MYFDYTGFANSSKRIVFMHKLIEFISNAQLLSINMHISYVVRHFLLYK